MAHKELERLLKALNQNYRSGNQLMITLTLEHVLESFAEHIASHSNDVELRYMSNQILVTLSNLNELNDDE